MRSKTLAVAAVGALLGIAMAAPAGAQTASDPYQPGSGQGLAKKKTKNPPAHVTVEKRSFLDAGTEVKPGQRKFTDYVYPPGYSPTAPIDFTTGNIRGPLVGPWDTSRNNFWPW
ncbi:MAG TPA: hypothetical protein VKW08_20170 [Xanthobacteraceae bacterium]|jgi:hypothetical protein|nr:hypothetical protein [Xanthobacteraceae bacterium]